MSMEETLPSGWAWASIDDLVSSQGVFRDGDWVESKDQDANGGVRLIQLADIGDGEFRDKSARFLTLQKVQQLNGTFLNNGDVLVARMPDPLGRACIFPLSGNNKFVTVVDVCVIRFGNDHIARKYFLFAINSPSLRRKISELQSGSTRKRISRGNLGTIDFPIAPLHEQHRIVAKIEELFSELDKGVDSLKTAREQLKVYRQALLKHAFEGNLTAQWRAENGDKLETASALQQRIQTERQERHRQQLADWETKGKQGSKPKVPKPLPPLSAEELAELPELPAGWIWVKLGELTWSVKDGPHFSPKYVEVGIPFISGGNVRPDGIDFSKAKQISQELHEELCKRCKPAVGDVLYTKGGTTGIARVNTYDKEFNVWVHVAVLKLTGAVMPFFLQHALNSSFCYSQSQKYTHGVGNQDLGLTRMVNIVLAVCSLPEQEEVIKEVDDKISIIDQLDQTLATALQQSAALRQSILKKAFCGQLVKQDKNDESASVLLERIRAEKLNGMKPGKREKSS